MPLDDVPVGATEDENVISKTVGEPTKFDFEPKNHAELAEAKGWLDKERAAKVAGSRFAYLMGDLVMLDWAMNMFALSKLTDRTLIAQLIEENGLNLKDTFLYSLRLLHEPRSMKQQDVLIKKSKHINWLTMIYG